jgi:DNA polymerase delta subunit 1
MASEMITKRFINPIRLEFEKIYFPYLLLSKKRYAGMLYTKPDKPDYRDVKGMENIRRDNCLLIR